MLWLDLYHSNFRIFLFTLLRWIMNLPLICLVLGRAGARELGRLPLGFGSAHQLGGLKMFEIFSIFTLLLTCGRWFLIWRAYILQIGLVQPPTRKEIHQITIFRGRDCHGGAHVRSYLQSEWCPGDCGLDEPWAESGSRSGFFGCFSEVEKLLQFLTEVFVEHELH